MSIIYWTYSIGGLIFIRGGMEDAMTTSQKLEISFSTRVARIDVGPPADKHNGAG